MEAIILCGLQATGKTTFCREKLFDTHLRLNYDMLKTRHRERLLLQACLESKQAFVVDNTNPTTAERAVYIKAARQARFRVVGYYFESKMSDVAERNARRQDKPPIAEVGLRATMARLERPTLGEGFDELFYVRAEDGAFVVEPWQDEQ